MAHLSIIGKYNTELRLWTMTCGCQKPAIHWSSDFNARVCQNCGTIIAEGDAEQPEKIAGPFVHLRVHTNLSFLRATCKIDELINKAKELGMPAVAKTEFGNMCGAPAFVKDCLDAGIKPILGTEFNVHFSHTVHHPVTFIALNHQGYRSLVKMTTTAWCARNAKDPYLEFGDIVSDGVLAIIGMDFDPNYMRPLVESLMQKVETWLGASYHGKPEDKELIDIAQCIGHSHRLPIVATNNVLYLNQEDHSAYEVAMKIGHHNVSDHEPEYYFKTPDEMYSSLDMGWCDNAAKIAARVEDYGIVSKGFIVPTFKDQHGEWAIEQAHSKLMMDSWKGLAAKGLSDKKEYVDRLTYELSVMQEKSFSSYFLIINEIVEYIKSRSWLKPVGRGSSVGSLVCYCLDITSMDPIKWGVPFERFINKGRRDLPDIDTDITKEGRPDVIRHIADIHGHDRVAQIATYQTMGLKAAIDNVGRALGVPHIQNRELRIKIPEEVESYDDVAGDIKAELAKTTGWVENSLSLTGIARHLGSHAAGIVISNTPLGDLVPLMPESDGLLGIQYDMRDIEILGLLKLDMLGLRNLDVIQHTLSRMKRLHGTEIDIYNLPPNDPATYQLISEGNYVSLFQLDSPGYRKLCRQLRPDRFEHVMALNALFRPGPLGGGMTDEYVNRRHGRSDAIGWHPWLDDVLSITYQVPVFQEQVMEIAKRIAGFDDVEADKYRKAIGKKNKEEFDKAQGKFKEGALKMKGLVPPPSFGDASSLEAWIESLLAKLAGYARYGWNLGHCLDKNSLVLTCNRGLVPIKDVKIGEEVWSVREKTGDLFRNRVVDVINNGVRDTVRVRSSDGRELVTTPDHRYFTSKQQYKNASELNGTDSLKMLEKGTFRRCLNIFMTSATHRNKIPVVVGLYNLIRNYVVKIKSNLGSTKHTSTEVPIQQFMSQGSTHLPAFSYFDSRSSISEELINTTGINEYSPFSKPPRDGGLAFVPHTSYFKDCLSYFWRNCVNAMSTQPTFLDEPGEGSWASFKWKLIKYIFATKSLCMQFPNQLLLLVIGVPFSIAYDAAAIISGCSVNRNFYTTSGALNSLYVVGPPQALGAMVDRNIIRSSKDFGALEADYLDSFHTKPLERSDITDVAFNSIISESKREVWDLTMEQDPNFIANGFVVHNSAGYGWITYITAYLEAHHPAEYYASLLGDTDKAEKVAPLMRGIISKGYRIVPPHVNESGVGYDVSMGPDCKAIIYMGLASIRSVGESADAIVTDREKNGKFGSFIEFCQRLPSVNKTVKVNLVKAGAFDWDNSICNRDKIDNVDIINKIIRRKNKKFDGSKIAPVQVAMECYITGNDYTDIQKQQNEREVLHSFITGHPAAVYQRLAPYLERQDTFVVCPSMVKHCVVGQSVLLVGMIDAVKKKIIQKEGRNQGRPYLVVTVSDNEDVSMFNVWWPMCDEMEKYLVTGQVAMFECVTKEDKFREGMLTLNIKHAIMLSHGLPVQGVFCVNGCDPTTVVTKVGGIVQDIMNIGGGNQYVSIRGGRITVMPDVLDDVVTEFGGNVKFLVSMEALEHKS